MTRKFLKSLDIADDVIEKIMAQYGQAVKQREEKAATEKDELLTQVALLTEAAEDYAAQKEYEKIDGLVQELLCMEHKEVGKLIPEFIPKAMKDYPREMVQLGEDGSILNSVEVVAYFAEEWGPAFGKVAVKSTYAAAPPKTGEITKNPWLPKYKCIIEQTRIFKENPSRAKELMKAAKKY